ncbi:5,10-methenyltetrahydrofolate synthetase [Serendipita sp. 396]|nr:5,10-methenyltetrahydrofolate synthetase [Serendipita sp. 396]
MTTIKAAKSALRKSMKQTLTAVSGELITSQSQAVLTRLSQLPQYQSSKSISCYVSMSTGEVQTDSIIQQALDDGKIVYVPRIMRDPPRSVTANQSTGSYMNLFRLYSPLDFETGLIPGVWGIREPNLLVGNTPRATVFDEESMGLDLILMPGMAFDRELARLGHGKGYYDNFIARYLSTAENKGWPKPTLIGLSLEEQVLDTSVIPMAEHDVRLDALVTRASCYGIDSEMTTPL